MLFDKNPGCFDMSTYTTGPVCVITAVQTQITELASLAKLQHLDKFFKAKFKDLFPKDIPHVCDLPTNVYHHIELRLGAPVSVASTYGCPIKCRAGWKMLINQHVAAGHI